MSFPKMNHEIFFGLGKILTDDNAISEYNIDEKKFIVVMVTKPKLPEKTDTGEGNSTSNATETTNSTTTTER